MNLPKIPALCQLTRFLLLIIVLSLSGCRSSRIESESSNSALTTRKSEVLDFLSEAESRVEATSYETKNAKAAVTYGTTNVSVRSNVTFTEGQTTTITARLVFPPVSVGKVEINGRKIAVTSKYLDKIPAITVPDGFNSYVQAALLGNVPKIYGYFGEKDFSNFNISLSSGDVYELSRAEQGISVRVGVNGSDHTLSYLRIVYGGYDISLEATAYERFSGKLLPSAFNVTIKSAKENAKHPSGKLEIQISDVTLLSK